MSNDPKVAFDYAKLAEAILSNPGLEKLGKAIEFAREERRAIKETAHKAWADSLHKFEVVTMPCSFCQTPCTDKTVNQPCPRRGG